MVDYIEHERYRFDRMTEKQLWTRLGKVTQETKLLYFAREAAHRGMVSLSRSALRKYRDKTGVTVDAPWVRQLDSDPFISGELELAKGSRAKAKAASRTKGSKKGIRKIRV